MMMKGYNFSKYDPNENNKSRFEQLLDIFMQLLTYTNGDVGEAMQWMNELDNEYKLTDKDYGMGDFYEDLKDKGYIDEKKGKGEIKITPKTEQGIRKKSLEEIFGKLKKTKQGNHNTFKPGGATKSILNRDPFNLVIHLSKLILRHPSAMHRLTMERRVSGCMKTTWK
jgi:Ca-activated chloride channel family protein